MKTPLLPEAEAAEVSVHEQGDQDNDRDRYTEKEQQ
jgi:hypothetical protein